MKKLWISIIVLMFFNIGYSQTNFWTLYSFKVAPGDEEKLVQAFDDFFETEVGKSLPIAMFNAVAFGSSETEYTHQMIFASPDKALFNKMYSPEFGASPEFQLLGMRLDQLITPVASYIGKAIDLTATPQSPFSMILEMDVEDPAAYVPEWKKLKAAVQTMWQGKINMNLHQVLSGNEEDVSHITVITAPNFETLLDFGDKIYSSDAFLEFAAKVGDIREIISNTTVINIKRYNLPEQMD